MSEIQVGTCRADITPPLGCRVGGYSARTGNAERVADPLWCRAFVFDDGLTPLALAVCDLLFVTSDISTLARRFIGEQLGWPSWSVMVTGTHTHSGPAGLTLALDRSYVEVVARQIAGAVAAAYSACRPAVIKYSDSGVLDSISQNRRDPDGPIETVARLLIAEAADGQATLATIVNYACHATVLEHDNLAISRDFPGSTVELVENALGGQAAYLQGCAGAINPVWMRHDHSEAARVGRILGATAVRAADEARPVGRGQWAVNLSWGIDTPKEPHGCRLVKLSSLSARSVTVKLAPRTRRPMPELDAELAEVLRAIDQQEDVTRRHALSARRAALGREIYFASHPYPYAVRHRETVADRAQEEGAVEVQVLRIGSDTAIVGLPGEPFLGIGDEIRQRSGLSNLLVAGYANEAIGYLPLASDIPLDGYEVGCAQYTSEAATALVNGALAALASTA